MRRTTLFVTLLLTLAALAIGVRWAFNTSSASPTNTLACSVKASCDVGELEVFRMSATSNAHAGTPAGSAYGDVLCCGGVHNLSTDCSAVHDIALTLSGTDNAHVAADGSYATQVCLSVPYGVADCTFGPTCGADYQCLATVSGDSNAHVADCDDVDDYATKVCCHVEDDNDNDGTLDPDDPDDDNDSQGLGPSGGFFRDDVETFIGTDPWDDCADTGTPNDETGVGESPWPPDFNDNGSIEIGDLVGLKNHWVPLGNPYGARYDLNATGDCDIGDLVALKYYWTGGGYDTCTVG